MKYLITAISIVLFFSNCNRVSVAGKIHGEKIKFWDIVDSTQNKEWGYSFSKEGKCTYYYYRLGECKRHVFDDGDLEYEDYWILKSDSILRFRSADHKILVLNEDTLLTDFKGHKRLLVKSKCP